MTILPTLFKKNKNGTYQQWTVSTLPCSPIIHTEYGQVGGQLQHTSKEVTAKNLGKSNEISAIDQAPIAAKAMWERKRDSNYVNTTAEADNVPILPMLAVDYTKHKKKIVWDENRPHYLQPKLDGCRMIARKVDGVVKLFSRKNKEWSNLGHIAEELKNIPDNLVLDGEVYLHGLTFQEITSLTKKFRTIPTQNLGNVHTTDLKYYLYDSFLLNVKSAPLTSRTMHRGITCDHITPLSTHPITSEQEIEAYHAIFVQEGYEGAILRICDGIYDIGHRSTNLLKIKSFDDAEFEIVDYYEGVGKFSGAVTWVCKLPNGGTVDCTPRGTMEQKREWFRKGDDYVGKLLKIKFFGYTDEGSLRFPVGLGIRLPEDI